MGVLRVKLMRKRFVYGLELVVFEGGKCIESFISC